jgi:hypothetical protein
MRVQWIYELRLFFSKVEPEVYLHVALPSNENPKGAEASTYDLNDFVSFLSLRAPFSLDSHSLDFLSCLL